MELRPLSLVLALASSLAGLATAELGHRLLVSGPHDRLAVEAELLRLVDPTDEFLTATAAARAADPSPTPTLHPFTGVEYGHDRAGVLAHFREDREPGRARVLLVGGSVASSIAPELDAALEERLPRAGHFGGRPARVLDFAHVTYKQPQQLHRVTHLLSMGYRPDAVVNVDGFNEVALSLQSARIGVHPTYPSPPLWPAINALTLGADPATLDDLGRISALEGRARRAAERFRDLGLGRSSLASAVALAGARGNWAERFTIIERRFGGGPGAGPGGVQDLRSRQLRGPDFDREPSAVLDAGVAAWFEGSLSLDAVCRARGIPYLHVLQPTLEDLGSKPRSELEAGLRSPEAWIKGASDGYPRLRARLPDLEAEGVEVVDASRLFAEDERTLYVDGCHYGPEGRRLVAEAVAEALLASTR